LDYSARSAYVENLSGGPEASSERWTDLEGRVRHPHDVGHTIYSLAALFARAVEACASSGAGAIAFDLFQP